MKKSQVKKMIREEILAEMGLNEMAKISGDLKDAIEKVIKDNPDLEGLDLKKAIKGDDAVEDALFGDTLYDNQLNKFIDLVRGRRVVGKRGRKPLPGKDKKVDESELNEMAKIDGALKTAIEKVIKDNPDLEGLPLKKAIKADDAVEDALAGDTLYDNQLNRFISLTRGERTNAQRGRKPLPKKKVDETELTEMAKIQGDLKSAIEKVIADNPELDGLPLKKAIKADDAVENALGGDTLYDNQLNQFIDVAKGRREVGKRGRKADPNKPAAEKKSSDGRRGRPASTKKKDSVATTSKLAKSYVSGDDDEPTDAELRKLARSGSKTVRGKTAQLRQQEARKMWKAWAREMEKKGIVDSANRILDKERFEAERVKQKPIIQAAVDKLEG